MFNTLWHTPETEFSTLLGQTITKIEGAEKGNDEIIFTLLNGTQYCMYHDQDCCESVTVEDVNGDINDLLNTPILLAEEATSQENPSDFSDYINDSFTWTFYKLATINGYVTIRWYGESNGYYSESVSFKQINKNIC